MYRWTLSHQQNIGNDKLKKKNQKLMVTVTSTQ
jgi:hypothetical protein